MLKTVVSISVLSLTLLLKGCGLTHSGAETFNQSTVNDLVLAEPLEPSIEAQITLARIEQLLAENTGITREQRAELHYQRGVLYDGFGLDGLAQYEFTLALEYKPNMAKAFHFLGVQHTQNQEFLKAFEAFDSVLEIDPQHTYALLNRAIALHYGGKQKLALDDLRTFHAHDNHDPYRLFWLYLVQSELDVEGANELLKKKRVAVESSHWAQGLYSVFLGNVHEDKFLALLQSDDAAGKTNVALAHKLCEAYFYLGKWHSLNKRHSLAKNYYKLALSTNVFEFVEHRFARLELAILEQNL